MTSNFKALTRRTFFSAALTVFALTALPAANALAAEDLADKIKRTGELRIGTEGVYPPFSFHDASGKLTGADVEFGRRLASKLGVKPVFVETPWEAMFAGLDSGRFDIVLNQISTSPERRQKYDFSEPYAYVKGVLVVQKNNTDIKTFADIKGRKSAQQAGSDWHGVALQQGADVVLVKDFSHAVEQVATGRAQALVNSELAVADFLKIRSNTPIKIVDKFKEGYGITIHVKKGNSKFLVQANKAIEELRTEGVLKELSLKYLGIDTSQK